MMSEPMAGRIRVLIADEDPLARERLKVLLAGEPDIELVGEAGNGVGALTAIVSGQPELVFLDVQLPDVDGLELVAALEAEAPEIVLVTAHHAYMERAFELHIADYLRKPYTNARFASALAHARKRVLARRLERGLTPGVAQWGEPKGSRQSPLLEALHAGDEYLRLALLDSRSGTWDIVRQLDIEWIAASGRARVTVHMAAEAYAWRTTLGAVAKTLDPRLFLRVHRSYIVNVRQIRQVKSLTKGEYMILLRGGTRLDTGRTYREVIERFLNGMTPAS